jgi:hypothetical protein
LQHLVVVGASPLASPEECIRKNISPSIDLDCFSKAFTKNVIHVRFARPLRNKRYGHAIDSAASAEFHDRIAEAGYTRAAG